MRTAQGAVNASLPIIAASLRTEIAQDEQSQIIRTNREEIMGKVTAASTRPLGEFGIAVVDVREPDEFEIAKVEGTTLLPLSQIEQRFTELDANQTIYLHCKAGVRSLKVLGFLREQGFKYLKSVKGGITAWSEEIDPNIPKY